MRVIKLLFLISFLNFFVYCEKSNGKWSFFRFEWPKLPSPKEFIDNLAPPAPNVLFNFANPFFSNHQSRKEDGNWNFFGRDFVKNALNAYKGISNFTGFSKVTTGLDTNLPKLPFVGDAVKAFQENLRAIFPGTQWCGDGNRARHFNDLGLFENIDKCCREHDNCPDYISSGEIKYDLENTGLFTRSHCSCDNKFYNCLKEINNVIATQIGFTYFTILGPQCFKEEYPIVGCLNRNKGKCEEYVFDEDANKTVQWFDNKRF